MDRTIIIPPDTQQIRVRLIGGGGGGGGYTTLQDAGGCAEGVVPVAPGQQQIVVSVGVGGISGVPQV